MPGEPAKKLYRLNQAGCDRFRELLPASKGAAVDREAITALSRDGEFIQEVVSVPSPIIPPASASALEFCQWMHELFNSVDLQATWNDADIFNWLAVYLFDVLRPTDSGPAQADAWIAPPGGKSRNYYKHLVGGPYMSYLLFKDCPECIKVILSQPMGQRPEVLEQLTGTVETRRNRAVLAAAQLLYWDVEGDRFRSGAGGKDPSKAPTRRFLAVIGQFSRTYDLYAMAPEQILQLLPSEFSRWMSKAARPARKIGASA